MISIIFLFLVFHSINSLSFVKFPFVLIKGGNNYSSTITNHDISDSVIAASNNSHLDRNSGDIDSDANINNQFNLIQKKLSDDIQSLKSQMIPENMPIFNFKTVLTRLINEINYSLNNIDTTESNSYNSIMSGRSFMELEYLFYNYITLLRDYYYDLFCSNIHDYDQQYIKEVGKKPSKMSRLNFYEETKIFITNEFISALNASTPQLEQCSEWNTEVR